MQNKESLKKFLIKAKKNTYASSGEGGEERLEDGGKELVYKEGDYFYRDRYYGYNPFLGEEIIFYNKKVIWGMNYRGRVVSDIIPSKEIYNFLKKALSLVNVNEPYRGPSNFSEGDFVYNNKVDGDVRYFRGEEKILYKGETVYNLNYLGGLIE